MKIANLDMTNKHFFRQMFIDEIINTNWFQMKSTLAVIMQFYVYNPNLFLVQEKRIVLEFLETGGFINMEHDSIIINMKLTRNDSQSARGNIIMVLGIVMIIMSVYDINEEYKAEQALKAA